MCVVVIRVLVEILKNSDVQGFVRIQLQSDVGYLKRIESRTFTKEKINNCIVTCK